MKVPFSSSRQGIKQLLIEHKLAGLTLLMLAGISLAAYVPWLGLVGDDWWFFAHLSDRQFFAAQLYENPARPMVALIWEGLWQAFGLHLWAYYLFNFLVQWLTALALYVLLQRLFRWRRSDAFAGAALFLLYPSDTARVYLAALPARASMLLAIVGAILWFLGQREKRRSAIVLGASMILMALSLLTYETSFFLLALLPFAQWIVRRDRQCLWRSMLACYPLLLAYLLFRLGVAYAVSQRAEPFYVSFQLTPGWLLAQLQAIPATVVWKGWLYALKTMAERGVAVSIGLFTLAMAALLLFLSRLQRTGRRETEGWRVHLGRIGAGAVLGIAALVPVIVSSFPLQHVVGTLDGRLVHGAGLGYAVLMTGLCALPGSLLPLSVPTRTALRTTLIAAFLAIALLGSLGVQRESAQAWRSQLEILQELQQQIPAFEAESAIALLDVPAGPFDIRLTYPFTQLVRRFTGDSTLHALPWQRGFPPAEQLVVFGQDQAIVVTEVVHFRTLLADYERMVAFRMDEDGSLHHLHQIDDPYLCAQACLEQNAIDPPSGWVPAQAAIPLQANVESSNPPPDTDWRRFLLAQIRFSAQSEVP